MMVREYDLKRGVYRNVKILWMDRIWKAGVLGVGLASGSHGLQLTRRTRSQTGLSRQRAGISKLGIGRFLFKVVMTGGIIMFSEWPCWGYVRGGSDLSR